MIVSRTQYQHVCDRCGKTLEFMGDWHDTPLAALMASARSARAVSNPAPSESFVCPMCEWKAREAENPSPKSNPWKMQYSKTDLPCAGDLAAQHEEDYWADRERAS